MTGPRFDVPQRRLGDEGRCGTIRALARDAWWSWGQPVFGVLVIAAAVAVFIVALQVRDLGIKRHADEVATAKAARVACVRSKELGPSLLLDYESRHVLSANQVAVYRSLIPTVCPTAP